MQHKKSTKTTGKAASAIPIAHDNDGLTSLSSLSSDNGDSSKGDSDQSGTGSGKDLDGGDEDDIDLEGLGDEDLQKVFDNEVSPSFLQTLTITHESY